MTRPILALTLWLLATCALVVDPMPFRDASEEARFRALAAELRCVMCQNQSL
ncbi:cytochrome c-type biogenesis protein CcmH, partial [Xanthomonadaceae bacterium JHOS43]|nr:cytochrome c-type biogenesis protein CcmH [Xanthomonadaceae bacterium JHOS43]